MTDNAPGVTGRKDNLEDIEIPSETMDGAMEIFSDWELEYSHCWGDTLIGDYGSKELVKRLYRYFS